MTEDQLKKIPFHFVSHLNMKHVHVTTYASEDGRLGIVDYCPMEDDCPNGRAYRHYLIEGNEYKTYKKFIEALKDYE